jgi:xanthine dehydrogenase YagR molybdenum-binding subunit
MVTSSIARGRIIGFQLDSARRTPGVLGIFTHHELANEIRPVKHLMAGGYANSSALPLGSPEIHYAGQIVALVVADAQESANEAAEEIRVTYEEQPAAAVLDQHGADCQSLEAARPGYKDPKFGDVRQAFATAAVTVDAVYRTPIQHHNPVELFGTTCVWHGDELTVYEPSRYIYAAQHGLAAQLGIDAAKVRWICPFLGGHFGSKLALSQYTAPVAIAARRLGRPVRYVASRSQCFTVANHRPDTQHRISIACSADGHFTALVHEAEMTTSRFDNFGMQGTDVTTGLYAWRAAEAKETLVHVDRNTPGPKRAPPEVPYLFALESAIDELGEKLSIDPVELRRRNDTLINPNNGKPFDPRPLMKCFDSGAEAFGWSTHNPKQCSRREGDWLIGYGCATSVRPVKRGTAVMRVAFTNDGRVTVETAHHEIGNGIYTVLGMQAAQRLGTNIKLVTVHLGDSALPPAGISGGSSTTTSLVPVLAKACDQIRDRLARAAVTTGRLAHVDPSTLRLNEGNL